MLPTSAILPPPEGGYPHTGADAHNTGAAPLHRPPCITHMVSWLQAHVLPKLYPAVLCGMAGLRHLSLHFYEDFCLSQLPHELVASVKVRCRGAPARSSPYRDALPCPRCARPPGPAHPRVFLTWEHFLSNGSPTPPAACGGHPQACCPALPLHLRTTPRAGPKLAHPPRLLP